MALAHSEKALLLQKLLREKALQSKSAARPALAAFPASALLDAELAHAIRPLGPARPLNLDSNVLLTGATGFLGAHLLADLHRLTTGTLFCLVRASNPTAARQRLEEGLRRYGFVDVAASPRIVPVIGDLAQPRLGLAPDLYMRLSAEVDVILHNGALLNHIAAYDRLRAANTLSTVEALRLAATGAPKWLYFISSMIAAADRNPNGELLEQLPQSAPTEITGGYAQTKWVSEKLLAEAHRRGFGVTVFRPGLICGRQDSGVWPADHDHLLLMLKGSLQMGFATGSSVVVDLTPVDFVSEAIVRIALAAAPHPVVHLSNPRPVPWPQIVAWMRECGYPMETVPPSAWAAKLADAGESNAMFPLLGLYLDQSVASQREALVAKLANVSRQITTPLLANLGLAYPSIEISLWQKYVRYCHVAGFFPAPQKETIR